MSRHQDNKRNQNEAGAAKNSNGQGSHHHKRGGGGGDDRTPMLTWGIKTNFHQYKAWLATAAITQFGNLGSIIEDPTQYYVEAELQIPEEELTDKNDPFGIKKEILLQKSLFSWSGGAGLFV